MTNSAKSLVFVGNRVLALDLHYAHPEPKDFAMDTTIWIPGTLALGLAALGLMVLFVHACDRIQEIS